MSLFDFKSAGVVVVATACALSLGLWMNHGSERGDAQGATAIGRVSGEDSAKPAAAPATGRPGQIIRAADGHYWAEAMIDGSAIRVLVDTGASVVALTREDALRLGLRLESADFTSTVNTASGSARAARVSLDSVAVAGARVENVDALVIEAGLGQSLLGMSYLGRLSAFEATPTALTLRP